MSKRSFCWPFARPFARILRSSEPELDDELRFHLAMEIEKNIEQGCDEAEARRRALLHFGGVEKVKEECRDERSFRIFEILAQDIKYALRTIAANPGFAFAAVLTMALGIGANTAIFSLVNGVLLQPLPYQDDRDLAVLSQSAPAAGIDALAFSIQEVYDYRDQSHSFSSLVEYHSMTFTLLGRGEPERVNTGVVSAEFFDVLGVRPRLGRTFRADDDAIGAEAVLVLSHEYWQRGFGGDEDIVGQVFEMNNRPHTVVGVLPPVPQFPRENDVYMSVSACPFRATGEQARHENRSAFRGLTVFGRLADGLDIDRAEADLDTIASRFRRDFPDTYHPDRGYEVHLTPLRQALTQGARSTLFLLLGITALVLLIACANVANLILARMTSRHREMAVRTSLGAGRGRLIRQLMAECTVLTATGGLLGLLVAYFGLDALIAFTARFTPRAIDVEIDGPVLVFTFLLSLASGLGFGAVAIVSNRWQPAQALRDGSRGSSGPGKEKFRSVLVMAQVAVSVLLLTAAGLVLRSLYKLQQVDPGFQVEQVLTAQLSLNWSRYGTSEDSQRFFSELLRETRSHPGVVSAAVSSDLPFERQNPRNRSFRIEGRTLEDGAAEPFLDLRIASTEYFRTIGIPLERGRVFAASDDAESLPVAIINRTMARRYWPRGEALDARLSFDSGSTWLTVVGIVGDVREYGPQAVATDELYIPLSQGGFAQRLLVRTVSDPRTMSQAIKNLVYAIDPDQPVAQIETMEDKHRAVIASPRLVSSLLALFAGLALVVTATGIGGLIAFSVSQRTHEIGIRMALGAQRRSVLGMVLRQAIGWIALGTIVGVATSLMLGGMLEPHLFEVAPNDPLTILLVVATLLAAAGTASLLPARRATSVDPSIALRDE